MFKYLYKIREHKISVISNVYDIMLRPIRCASIILLSRAMRYNKIPTLSRLGATN